MKPRFCPHIAKIAKLFVFGHVVGNVLPPAPLKAWFFHDTEWDPVPN
jgi:hypothetical protein